MLGESDVPTLDPIGNKFAGAPTAGTPSGNLDILDLLGDISNMSAPVMPTHAGGTIAAQQSLFGNVGAAATAANGLGGSLFDDGGLLSPSGNMTNNNIPSLDGAVLGLGSGVVGAVDDFAAAATASTNAVRLVALDKNGINVVLVPQKLGFGGGLQVVMTATNRSATPIEQFLFQAAVPKSFAVQMLSASGTALAAGGGVITQEMRLTSSAKVSRDGRRGCECVLICSAIFRRYCG